MLFPPGSWFVQGGRPYISVATSWTEIQLPISFTTEGMSCAATMGTTNGVVDMYFSSKSKLAYKATQYDGGGVD